MIAPLPVISVTNDAMSQPVEVMALDVAIQFMRCGWHRAQVKAIRTTFARVLAETGDAVAAKKAIDADKKRLPAFMFGGKFKARGDKNLEVYSKLLCGDVDGVADNQMEQVFNLIANDPHTITASISPSGAGVKFLCWSSGDAAAHKRAFAAMEKYFTEKHGIAVDPACKNLERLCFAPDNATDLRPDAVKFDPLPETQKPPTFSAPAGESRPAIAGRLLGKIEWSDESTGFCKCPGEHLHTGANGAKDCMVLLLGVPTVKCFHNSCAGIVAGVNHELRSQIGKAEFVPGNGQRHVTPHNPAPLVNSDSPPDSIYDEYIQSAPPDFEETKKDDLPDFIDAALFQAEQITPPAELIKGILHKGSKLAFGGSSKSFKTWCLLDLAISVATGSPWMGRETEQGKVLFLNFEIQPYAWQQRIAAIVKSKVAALDPGRIILWNLRGHAAGFKILMPRISARCDKENFSLIVLDPIYKLYGGTDENAAGDVAELLNSLEALATRSGAAIAFGAHFAKGNASAKEAIDRISGSGVFARDPDSLLIFTKHEEDDAFTVEPILRNFAPVAPFAVRWNFPLMEAAEDLDPSKLKEVGGRKKEHVADDLLGGIPDDGFSHEEFKSFAFKKGMSQRTFDRLKSELKTSNKIHWSRIDEKWLKICGNP
jgi:hypothetical protein